MTAIIHTNAFGIPVLISDMLISGSENENKPIKIPTHTNGIDEVFPEGSGYVPTNLRRKSFIINDTMAVGLSGSMIHMNAFLEDLQEEYSGKINITFDDLHSFMICYSKNDHGRNVIDNIHAMILLNDGENFIFYIVGNQAKLCCTETDTKKFGKIVSIGSGQSTISEEAKRLDKYHLQRSSKANTESQYSALSFNLSLISQLHKIDSLTGRNLLEYWGGGYEILYYNKNKNKFMYLDEYSVVFWNLNLDKNEGLAPYGVLSYERNANESIIYTNDRAGINIFPVKNINDFGKRTLKIKNSNIDFNSEIMVNLVLVSKENRIHNIYNFIDRHTTENPGVVFIDKTDEGKMEILCQSEFGTFITRNIREIEQKRSQAV